jgi:hypothetical protein
VPEVNKKAVKNYWTKTNKETQISLKEFPLFCDTPKKELLDRQKYERKER